MAEVDDEGRPVRRPKRHRENNMSAFTGENPVEDDGRDPSLRYNIKEIEKKRTQMADLIWRAVAEGKLNLSDERQLGNFLTSIGLKDQKEEGRHMRRLFLGWLGDEGWGRNEQGYGTALDYYKPNWRRMIEGMTRDPKTGLYGTDGGKWYDAFGRLVRTDPITPTPAPTPTPVVSPSPVPSTTTTSPSSPTSDSIPPAFYGGTTAPNPYGTSPTILGQRPQVTPNNRRRLPNRIQNQTPGWYSTWRF